MIYSDQSPVTFADPLPRATEVVVIGAGVAGICTAWFLSRAGVPVVVCDKGRVAGEQSSRNWGWIRQQGRDADELPIAIESVNAWQSMAPELDTDIGFTRTGVLYTAQNEREMASLEQWQQLAQQHQVDTRVLSGAEVADMIDDSSGEWQGGLFTASDARAEPFKAVPALARRLQADGVLIREACAVRSLDLQGGKVNGVVTEAGRIQANTVVLAGGAWSSVFLGNLGVVLPQLTVRATVARTEPAPDIFGGAAALGGVAIRRRQDGGYTVAAGGTNEHFIGVDSFRFMRPFVPALRASRRSLSLRFGGDVLARLTPQRQWGEDDISPFERRRVLNPAPSDKSLDAMRRGLAARVPKLAELRFEESWAGMIDVMPDVVPVMDHIDAVPGLYLATGFSGHGFGFGPGAGRVMADMVLGHGARHDLSRFRFGRFSDGSNMRPGPGL